MTLRGLEIEILPLQTEVRDRPLRDYGQDEIGRRLESLPMTSREIEAQTRIIDAQDAHVLAAALKGGVEFLLTLDRRHFMTRAVLEAELGFAILLPGDFLRRLVGSSE